MKARIPFASVALLCCASASSIAVQATAQAPAADAKTAIQAQTELTQARTAEIQAKTAQMDARLASLGLKTDATGKTELKEKGGELEGWMLATGTLAKAATIISDSVRQKAGTAPVVLLAAEEPFGLDLPATLRLDMDVLERQMDRAGSAACVAPVTLAATSLGVAPLLGAAIGAIKTDTEVSGFDGPSEARLLVNAIAATNGRWTVFKDAVRPAAHSALEAQWRKLQDKGDDLFTCRATLAVGVKPPADRIAIIDRALASVDAFNTRVSHAADGGPTLLARAVQADAIDPAALVLRVYIEKAGGSILLRKNLWTALGAPAVGITGGAIVSYRLSDPGTGTPKGAGVLVCRTTLTSMRAIQNGRVGRSDCQPSLG